ncbi:MAG: lysine N(6)-hydroxylase/L-ornithine N(5)-oxygenase family protein [Pseudonocardiaceae bacterium]
MTRMMSGDVVEYDVVGVGFGPSNLALAIAIDEFNQSVSARQRLLARFVERQPRFGWHRGMLLEDAMMQVSFLKDLVTLRNPASSFSFLSYLHSRGRLVDFINYASTFPTRIEFHDYLEWAAARFVAQVAYHSEAIGITPVRPPGAGEAAACVDVVSNRSGGDVFRLRARNIVLATGLQPNIPDEVVLSDRVWHNRDLLTRVAALGAARPQRLVVVGAGQSAAETVDYLHRRFPSATVCAVFARYGYSPADDSSFANRVFDPAAVDDFYTAPESVKGLILGYHANTNYSVVDSELIEQLYHKHYQEKVTGAERLQFFNVSRITRLDDRADCVELVVESMVDGERELLVADAVVYATGYRPSDPSELLGDLVTVCERDGQGRFVIGRDYRIATGSQVHAGIYVQGATEHTHGISSTLLSNVAVRAGEIVAAVTDTAGDVAGCPSIVTASAGGPERPR